MGCNNSIVEDELNSNEFDFLQQWRSPSMQYRPGEVMVKQSREQRPKSRDVLRRCVSDHSSCSDNTEEWAIGTY